MDPAAWLIAAASLSFSATLAAYVILRTVPRANYDEALRQLAKQQDTIDRLLARNFERLTGDDADRLEGQFLTQKPVEKPE